MSWDLVAAATSYNVYFRANGAGPYTRLENQVSGFIHLGLTNGTPYTYFVKSVGPGGEGAASAEATGTPSLPPAPSAPSAVTVTPGDARNTITWDLLVNAATFNIYWRLGAGASTADTKITSVVSPYVHTPITNGALYSYVVTGQNRGGEGPASASVSGTPSAPPVYVSVTTGNDANAGTQAQPVRTLARAYTIASGTGTKSILMEVGTYNEVPTFRAAINVDGGYVLPAWTQGTGKSVFTVGTITANANNINVLTRISQITIQASDNLGSGGRSIALTSRSSTSALTFLNCRFVSAAAGSGSAGSGGANRPKANDAGDGSNGTCDAGNGGGGFGASGACAGGAGGAGGPPGANDGARGGNGACIDGGGGSFGGTGGDPGRAGGRGQNGGNGLNGANGTPGSAAGSASSGDWFPSISLPGGDGGAGSGAGGGGGGGGQGCAFCDDGGGNGGGGGGAGASGGGGGSFSSGGWPSFAVFLFASSPTFTNCQFQSGAGGNGGQGGPGGFGGQGGFGGFGAGACTGEIGAGGDGGDGGFGGRGGGSAGGPGGPSYCVYKAGGSAPVITGAGYVVGAPGTGGAGGVSVLTAPNGPTGLSGNIN